MVSSSVCPMSNTVPTKNRFSSASVVNHAVHHPERVPRLADDEPPFREPALRRDQADALPVVAAHVEHRLKPLAAEHRVRFGELEELHALPVAAHIKVSVRRVYIQLSSAFPLQELFTRCQQRLGGLASRTG
jgi:hypothetical protein